MDHRETEAAPFVALLGREEGLEHAIEDLVRHAVPVVLHRQDRPAPRRHVTVARRKGRLDLGPPKRDGEHPASPHGVPRVDRQIHRDLMNALRVRFHHDLVVRLADAHHDVVGQAAAQELADILDHAAEIDRWVMNGVFVLAADGQETSRELGAGFRRIQDGIHVRRDGMIGRELSANRAGATTDDGQDVVEVVGDAASEPGDPLQLVRLKEPTLHRSLLGVCPEDRATRGETEHHESDHQRHRAEERAPGGGGPPRRREAADLEEMKGQPDDEDAGEQSDGCARLADGIGDDGEKEEPADDRDDQPAAHVADAAGAQEDPRGDPVEPRHPTRTDQRRDPERERDDHERTGGYRQPIVDELQPGEAQRGDGHEDRREVQDPRVGVQLVAIHYLNQNTGFWPWRRTRFPRAKEKRPRSREAALQAPIPRESVSPDRPDRG